MDATLGYRENGGVVQLTMTREDFSLLLFVLGYAGGRNGLSDPHFFKLVDLFKLLDRINEGNPAWRQKTHDGSAT